MTDLILERVLGPVDLTTSTIVLVADHGHTDSGGHGGLEPEVVDVPLVMAGAGVRPGVTLVDAYLVDVAPTIAALLGLPAPGHALGRTLVEALTYAPEEARALRDVDGRRWARLQTALEQEREREDQRALAVGARRGAGIVVALLVAGVIVILSARGGLAVVDRRVLLLALPAFPLTFYSMLAVFENWLSPSMIPGESSLASMLFGYGAVAAAVHLGAAWFSLTRRPTPHARLAAACGITATGLLVALAPVGLAWRLASPALVHALPDPRTLMLAPVVYAAVACYGMCAMLTIAVELAVFVARVTGKD
jgi:hypothetical protein